EVVEPLLDFRESQLTKFVELGGIQDRWQLAQVLGHVDRQNRRDRVLARAGLGRVMAFFIDALALEETELASFTEIIEPELVLAPAGTFVTFLELVFEALTSQPLFFEVSR